MKTQKIFLSVIIIFSSLITNAQIQKAEFQASGLTCSMCSNAINQALKTVSFIEKVNTDLNKNIFEITFKKDAAIDLDVIKSKVEDAGFSIAKFWVVVDLQNQKISNDVHAAIAGINFHFMNVKPQTLNGSQRLQLIDKNYISAKDYKKFSSYTTMPCYQTGIMGSCCKSKDGAIASSNRIYHVTI